MYFRIMEIHICELWKEKYQQSEKFYNHYIECFECNYWIVNLSQLRKNNYINLEKEFLLFNSLNHIYDCWAGTNVTSCGTSVFNLRRLAAGPELLLSVARALLRSSLLLCSSSATCRS